jgi:hypothetical protein
VHARSTQAVAGQERAELADRQRGLARVVAEGQRLAVGVLEQLVANRVRQLVVDVRNGEVRVGVAKLAALETDDGATRFRQLGGDDRSGPTETDTDRVDRLEVRSHLLPPSLGPPHAHRHDAQGRVVGRRTGRRGRAGRRHLHLFLRRRDPDRCDRVPMDHLLAA